MFIFKLICIGKLKEDAFKNLERLYLRRIKTFAKIVVIEIPEVPYGTNQSPDQVKEKEAALITAKIGDNEMVILLDEAGQERTSKDFSLFLERVSQLGQHLTFIVGGSLGLHQNLKVVANYTISLSKLTFPHSLARVVFLEQLYRSITIIKRIDYHK